MLETAYAATPHPDLAAAYVRLRHGDSAGDRLTRARALARVAPFDPESVLTVARAALEAQDLPAARKAMAPLVGAEAGFGRPTARACILMAEIEDAAGDDGAVREWLNRAARARRDRAWVADAIISDKWAPASPSGALDAFVWRTPDERSTEPPPAIALRAAPPPRRPCRRRHRGQTRAGRARGAACARRAADRASRAASGSAARRGAAQRARRPRPERLRRRGFSELRHRMSSAAAECGARAMATLFEGRG